MIRKHRFFVRWKRSITQAMRQRRYSGNINFQEIVDAVVGAEQDIFTLVDSEKFLQRKRPDLYRKGRCLARCPPKGSGDGRITISERIRAENRIVYEEM